MNSNFKEHKIRAGREIAGKYFFAFILAVLMYCIVRVSWWSFEQTQQFLRVFDDPTQGGEWISFAFAVIFQYGQNPAVFWGMVELRKMQRFQRMVARYTLEKGSPNGAQKLMEAQQEYATARRNMIVSFSIFGIFALVDAGTNIGQFNTGRIGMNPLAWILGNCVCIVVVFIEEFFMKILNIFFHIVNDIRVSHGFPRWSTLDAFDPALLEEITYSGNPINTSATPDRFPGNIGPSAMSRHSQIRPVVPDNIMTRR